MDIPRRVPNFFPTSTFKDAEESVTHGKITVLYGLSGSGKTQICARIALKYKDDPRNKVFFINATSVQSRNRDIANQCSKFDLSIEYGEDNLLPRLLAKLSSLTTGQNVVILDSLEDKALEGILESLDQENLNSTSVIVASQEKPSDGYKKNSRFRIIHVNGFSEEEASKYLGVPKERLKEILDSISNLPVALNPFRQAYHSERVESDDDYINRYLCLMEESPEMDGALKSIKICLDKAVAERPSLEKILKYLSVFCEENITNELFAALIEEAKPSLSIDEASSICEVVVRRSIVNSYVSDTQRKYLTLHALVKKAVNELVKNEEDWTEILSAALRAFSRVMPCDGRHHQTDVIPKLLKHALSLEKSFDDKIKSQVDRLTKLLFAELQTSIGYCMMSQRYEAEKVIKQLEEGKKVYLNLLFLGDEDEGFNKFQSCIDGYLQSALKGQSDLQQDGKYMQFIKSLQMMYRLSERDFKTLFPDANSKSLCKLKTFGHLSNEGFDQLIKQTDSLLLKVDDLAAVYPLELFAHNLHLLSKAYGNLKKDQAESAKISKEADAIYSSIEKQSGVTLLGMYVNKRFLYNMVAESADRQVLEELCKDWEELRTKSVKVYECGIVRSKELSEDKIHKMHCLEGEMLVYGQIARKTEDPNAKEEQASKGKEFIVEIEKLCKIHERKHYTFSRAYIIVSKFYELCAEYEQAVSYSVKSMMRYRKDCLQKQKKTDGHPELDADKISKFEDSYKQLKSCLDSLNKGNRLIRLTEKEEKYLVEVSRVWQVNCGGRGEDMHNRFEAIDEVLKLGKLTALPIPESSGPMM